MNKFSISLSILFILCFNHLTAQDYFTESFVKEMSWGMDYKIELTLENDSVYIYDIKNLHHTDAQQNSTFNNFTYYPVNMSEDFISKLKNRGVEHGFDTTSKDSIQQVTLQSDKTLWSALHGYIGGGWVHFVNTLLYSLEYGFINTRTPLMKRPESNWKPKPMTESYKRTKNWEYYIPTTQKDAIKEYKIRKERNELGDLQHLPEKFIELFLNTSDKDYAKLQKLGRKRELARIDMIRLLLGANYLGQAQINYIKHMVLKGINQYSANKLPSVIIFDNFNAAVAMSLNEQGYKIEKIVFKDEDRITQDDIDIRTRTIESLIKTINGVNMEIFRERLSRYYR
jgi:hypothetical protein